jgi:PEP-CTERM motif
MNTHPSAPAGRLTQLKKSALALAAGAVLGLSSGAVSAVETTFVGFTNGCFGLGCVPASASGPQTINLGSSGLSYNSSTFDATTSGGFVSLGSAGATSPAGNLNNLGSFTLTGDPQSYFGNAFDLLVTFMAPLGTTPGTAFFTDTIIGSVTSNDVGGVFINFDNSIQHFTFAGGGGFDFFINDVSLTAGRTIALSGTIISAVSPVPEPEAYALFMAGLAAVGFMARRRKT